MNRTEVARPGFAGVIAIAVMFAALARGAHDLWAATIIHALLLGWTAAFLVTAYRHRGETAVRLPLLAPAGFVLGAAALSSAFAANRFDALFALKDLTAALLAFYAGANAFQTDADLDLLLMLMIPVFWIQAATMVLQLLSVGAWKAVESPGTLVNANIQAAFALMWTPPLLVRALAARKDGHRFGYFASGAAAALAVVALAGSTWALLCLLVALVGAAALRADRPGLAKGLLGAGALLVAVTLVFKLTQTEAGGDRLRWWTAALNMLRDHPWLGVGPGGFPSAYPAYKQGAGQSTLFAHSLPLMVLAEAGLAGAAAAVAFFVSWKRRAALTLGQRGAFAAGAVLFVVQSLVNVGAEYLVNQLTFGLFLGISLAGVPARLWRPRLSVAVVATGLAVLALPLLSAPFLASRFIVDGTSLLAEKDAAGAEKRFRFAIELDPTNWEAHQGLAMAVWTAAPDSGEAQRTALEELRRAIALNRLNPALRAEEARLAEEVGG